MTRAALVAQYTHRVTESITRAIEGESGLNSEDIKNVDGKNYYRDVESMNQPEYWHILNNLCSYEGVVHTHVGFWKGGSLFPCIDGNDAKIYGIDSFFGGSAALRQEFLDNVERLGVADRFTLIGEDCFTFDRSQIKEKVNFHLYDNGHQYEDQYQGILYFEPVLADVCIIMVDNFVSDNTDTEGATDKAIDDMGYDVRHKYVREIHCHQGYYVVERR